MIDILESELFKAILAKMIGVDLEDLSDKATDRIIVIAKGMFLSPELERDVINLAEKASSELFKFSNENLMRPDQ
ncbi:MAG: hypothetical protein M0Q44_01105 [Methylobacter sp.]|jgi:hypothetical protein|nr:hypothetical protein [Methylobacter sp.]